MGLPASRPGALRHAGNHLRMRRVKPARGGKEVPITRWQGTPAQTEPMLPAFGDTHATAVALKPMQRSRPPLFCAPSQSGDEGIPYEGTAQGKEAGASFSRCLAQHDARGLTYQEDPHDGPHRVSGETILGCLKASAPRQNCARYSTYYTPLRLVL